MPDAKSLASTIRESAYPLTGAREDYDPLMKLIGDARFVLLGEASHGTHEFYAARAEITKRLPLRSVQRTRQLVAPTCGVAPQAATS